MKWKKVIGDHVVEHCFSNLNIHKNHLESFLWHRVLDLSPEETAVQAWGGVRGDADVGW